MHAVQEIRALLDDNGFQESAISVEAYHEERDPQPPIRVSYLRYVAEAPECGNWPTNLAEQNRQPALPQLRLRHTAQPGRQVANPADLLGPRTETARSSERRGVHWDKYVKGKPTGASKSRGRED